MEGQFPVYAVKKERLIIDGDLLKEFQHLPGDIQKAIAVLLSAALGRAYQPAALIALLQHGA